MPLQTNKNLFFLVRDGKLIVWDVENHTQYDIEQPFLERLINLSDASKTRKPSVIDSELLEAGLLKESRKEIPPHKQWGWDDLSWIFHKGTKDPTILLDERKDFIENYIDYCEGLDLEKIVSTQPEDFGDCIKLSTMHESDFNGKGFFETLKNRRTTRSFSGETVDFKRFSTLLISCFSFKNDPWMEVDNIKIVGQSRLSPSAGGLHPCDGYVFINNVENMMPGIYKYIPQDEHNGYLKPINLNVRLSDMTHCVYGQPFLEGCGFGVFLVLDFSKIWTKYPHSRGYRHALLDAGHLSQTILLCATNLGLLTWLTAAIRDTEAESMLNLEGEHLSPAMFVGFGCGSYSPI